MGVVTGLIVVYGIGTALVAARLGWHVAFRLDAYDWQYGDVWTSFAVSMLLWPLLLLRPRLLFEPGSIFQGGFGVVERMRELDRLQTSPPPCGSRVRYRPAQGEHTQTFGDFVFSAIALERQLKSQLSESPHLANGQRGGIHNWLQQHDTDISEPTDVPSLWSEFGLVADASLARGEGEATCLRCGVRGVAGSLTRHVDTPVNWIYHRWTCANGHPLLVVSVAHFFVRPGKPAESDLIT